MKIENVKTSQDAKALGLPVFKVLSDSAIKAYKDEDGTRRFEVTASSDADDLVGDWFSEKALNKMGDTSDGMTMFLNHSYNVPEDVFGSVEKATVAKKSVFNRVLSKEVECWCLTYSGVVTEVNDRAVKTHELMMEGKVTLGASVSVLITNSSPQKSGGRQIDDVVNLECSIVGLPCNPTSWVTAASKALKLFDADGSAPEGEAGQGELHRPGGVLTGKELNPVTQGLKDALQAEPEAVPAEPVAVIGQTEKTDEGRIAKQAFGMMLVGLIVAKKRAERGLKVLELMASAAKMTTDQVNDVLNGVFETISEEALKGFSEVLGVTVQWPMAGLDALTATSMKGIFNDEFTENTANIYFLTGTLEGAYHDLRRGVRAGTVRVEEIPTLLGEGLNEFSVKCLELLTPQLAAEFGQHDSDYDPWGYWSASALEQANRIEKTGVSKAGARNSKQDSERLQKMHDLCVEMGVSCKAAESDSTTGEADADVKGAPEADKTATLEIALTQKDAEIADLKATLGAAVKMAEDAAAKAKKAAEETEDWKAVSQQALQQLEAFGQTPLPRKASAASTGTTQ